MFPCSLRYFANVPLFPKTPGRPSIVYKLAGLKVHSLNKKDACFLYFQYKDDEIMKVKFRVENNSRLPMAAGTFSTLAGDFSPKN